MPVVSPLIEGARERIGEASDWVQNQLGMGGGVNQNVENGERHGTQGKAGDGRYPNMPEFPTETRRRPLRQPARTAIQFFCG